MGLDDPRSWHLISEGQRMRHEPSYISLISRRGLEVWLRGQQGQRLNFTQLQKWDPIELVGICTLFINIGVDIPNNLLHPSCSTFGWSHNPQVIRVYFKVISENIFELYEAHFSSYVIS